MPDLIWYGLLAILTALTVCAFASLVALVLLVWRSALFERAERRSDAAAARAADEAQHAETAIALLTPDARPEPWRCDLRDVDVFLEFAGIVFDAREAGFDLRPPVFHPDPPVSPGRDS